MTTKFWNNCTWTWKVWIQLWSKYGTPFYQTINSPLIEWSGLSHILSCDPNIRKIVWYLDPIERSWVFQTFCLAKMLELDATLCAVRKIEWRILRDSKGEGTTLCFMVYCGLKVIHSNYYEKITVSDS